MNHKDDEQLELLIHLFGNEQSTASHTKSGQVEEMGESAKSRSQAPESVHRHSSSPQTRPDAGRERRKGIPEVIFAETKGTEQIIAMARGLLAGTGRVIISCIAEGAIAPVQAAFEGYTVRVFGPAHALVISTPEYIRPVTGGHVGVISAGTSDIPVAEEAALLAEEMGCRITRIYDVGVAGLHRLLEPLRALLSDGVDVIIVAAGMDGALPSVVTGLVPVPVIGLPTSIGYGIGGKGLAALLSMLQTCAPGLTVVNIDNGVGAGSTAALIANRLAQAREHKSQ